MTELTVYDYLPPIHQKMAVLVLGLLGALWIVWMVRNFRIREEHALLWFLCIGTGIIVVWIDPLLVAITRALGVEVPASSLLLLALFALFILCAWLTSVVSTHQREIARLTIAISILKSNLEVRPDLASENESQS